MRYLLVLILALCFIPTSQSDAVYPSIYFKYAMNCTFNIVDDNGNSISSISPGKYQIDVRTPIAFGTISLIGVAVNDFTACHGMPQFQLTGPNVSIFTTLTAGCMSEETFLVTLQPNSVYNAQDNNQPAVAKGAFTTLSGGSPISPVLPTKPGKPSSQPPILGSGIKKTHKIHAIKSNLGW